MVTNVTSLTGNGLKDWLIQRATAVYFALFILFVFAFIVMHPQLQQSQWQLLFSNPWMKIASIIAAVCYVLHSWIGIWTVTTDYIKCTAIRLSVQLAVILFLLAQFIWVVLILWGQ